MTQHPDHPSFEPPVNGPRPGEFSGPQQPIGSGDQPGYGQALPYGTPAQPAPPYQGQPPAPYPQATPPQGPAWDAPGTGFPDQAPAPQGGPLGWPATPNQTQSAAEPTELVGKGLGFAVIGIVAGCLASAALYHWGFIASIVAFGMSVGMLWLYVKGAGAPPRKGAVPLLALVVAGLVITWIFTLGAELYLGAMSDGATAGEAFAFATGNLTNPKLYSLTAKDALFFFGFGALGMFGTVRQLLGARKAA